MTANLDYGRLDRSSSPARIRLNSTVVNVRHRGDVQSAREVEVTYVTGDKAQRVRGNACIFAGYGAMIPYLCPELPASQREALNSHYTEVKLDFPVSLGNYRHSRTPDEPIVLHLERTPCHAGLPVSEQHRLGRYELLAATFEQEERAIRTQLARMLSPGGFDPSRDILAITVNRWPHGYARSDTPPNWSQSEEPWEVGRRRYGRIAFAGSDSAAMALTQAAIDQALRAVNELVAKT